MRSPVREFFIVKEDWYQRCDTAIYRAMVSHTLASCYLDPSMKSSIGRRTPSTWSCPSLSGARGVVKIGIVMEASERPWLNEPVKLKGHEINGLRCTSLPISSLLCQPIFEPTESLLCKNAPEWRAKEKESRVISFTQEASASFFLRPIKILSSLRRERKLVEILRGSETLMIHLKSLKLAQSEKWQVVNNYTTFFHGFADEGIT